MEDKGYFESIGELLRKTCTGSLRKHLMNLDMHTMLLDTKLLNATLLNMYNPTLMETILKELLEQFIKDDPMKAAGEIIGFVPETSLDWESNLKERGFWEGHSGKYPLKIWC